MHQTGKDDELEKGENDDEDETVQDREDPIASSGKEQVEWWSIILSWDISHTDLGEGEDNDEDDEEDGEVVGCLCLCVFVCEEDPLAPGG